MTIPFTAAFTAAEAILKTNREAKGVHIYKQFSAIQRLHFNRNCSSIVIWRSYATTVRFLFTNHAGEWALSTPVTTDAVSSVSSVRCAIGPQAIGVSFRYPLSTHLRTVCARSTVAAVTNSTRTSPAHPLKGRTVILAVRDVDNKNWTRCETHCQTRGS